jgi:DNA mismatch endonuclease (patch repair protein)
MILTAMPDTYPADVRSRVMARVKGRDTGPELALRRALYAAGVRGWRCHRKTLPGSPDLSFGRARLAVFVDGGFWHGHPTKWWPGRSGPYWDEKIERNIARDRRVDAELEALGWKVLRLWDFEIVDDPAAAARAVIERLDDSSERAPPCGSQRVGAESQEKGSPISGALHSAT